MIQIENRISRSKIQGIPRRKTHRGTGSLGGEKGDGLTPKCLKCDPDSVYPDAIVLVLSMEVPDTQVYCETREPDH